MWIHTSAAVASILVVLLANDFFAASSCPEDAFAWQFPADGGYNMVLLAQIASAVWFASFLAAGLADPKPLPTKQKLLFAASIAGVLFGIVLAVNQANRFACATPSGIFVRNGASAAIRNLSWDDVRFVEASCWTRNVNRYSRRPWAGLFLGFRDRSAVVLEFPNDDRIFSRSSKSAAEQMNAVRASMRGKDFTYIRPPILTENLCPAGVHQVIEWFKD